MATHLPGRAALALLDIAGSVVVAASQLDQGAGPAWGVRSVGRDFVVVLQKLRVDRLGGRPGRGGLFVSASLRVAFPPPRRDPAARRDPLVERVDRVADDPRRQPHESRAAPVVPPQFKRPDRKAEPVCCLVGTKQGAYCVGCLGHRANRCATRWPIKQLLTALSYTEERRALLRKRRSSIDEKAISGH
jgi:hypothetical protein